MKKVLLLVVFAFITLSSYSVSGPVDTKKPVKASDVVLPVGDKYVTLEELSQMKAKDFEKLTGKNLKLAEKLAFKIGQKELKRSINPDGTVNKAKMSKLLKKASDEGFHLGGFALGFLLGLIGVLIAYLIKDDKKRNRVKWAWIGWAAWVVVWLIILLV